MSTQSEELVEVVAAAIVSPMTGRILLTQRSEDTSYPGLWCTPGGKVEPGETHRDALARELREEIGVELEGDLGPVVYQRRIKSTRTGKDVFITCYRIDGKQITNLVRCGDKVAATQWATAAKLAALELTPADAEERAALLGALRQVAATRETMPESER